MQTDLDEGKLMKNMLLGRHYIKCESDVDYQRKGSTCRSPSLMKNAGHSPGLDHTRVCTCRNTWLPDPFQEARTEVSGEADAKMGHKNNGWQELKPESEGLFNSKIDK